MAGRHLVKICKQEVNFDLNELLCEYFFSKLKEKYLMLLYTTQVNKERFQLAENLRSARCSPFVISKVLAARMRMSITASARKKKSKETHCSHARKDHSILFVYIPLSFQKKKRKSILANL